MKTEFRKAILPQEIGSLLAFDRKAFPKADRFDRACWQACESHWLIVGNTKVGCCAFEKKSVDSLLNRAHLPLPELAG